MLHAVSKLLFFYLMFLKEKQSQSLTVSLFAMPEIKFFPPLQSFTSASMSSVASLINKEEKKSQMKLLSFHDDSVS